MILPFSGIPDELPHVLTTFSTYHHLHTTYYLRVCVCAPAAISSNSIPIVNTYRTHLKPEARLTLAHDVFLYFNSEFS